MRPMLPEMHGVVELGEEEHSEPPPSYEVEDLTLRELARNKFLFYHFVEGDLLVCCAPVLFDLGQQNPIFWNWPWIGRLWKLRRSLKQAVNNPVES